MLEGNLHKMSSVLETPVSYSLELVKKQETKMNSLIGKKISIEFSGQINCVHCQRETKKSFSGGYCYPCSRKLAETDMCILKPETCHFAKGTCRDETWAQSHCMQPHFVYLANSSGLKVGITRQSQVPTRWIDQGAIGAIPIFKVKTRYHSGVVETLMKKYMPDKTNWRKMLTNDVSEIDLEFTRNDLADSLEDEIEDLKDQQGIEMIEFVEDPPTFIEYPVNIYPEKIKSLSLDKMPSISGVLNGIKGQYLILDVGVFNVRKHSGYKVRLSF